MGFPLAISPTVRSAGLALAINLLAAPSSPGTAPLRACVIAVKDSTGTITADTQLVLGLGGADDGGTYFGVGTQGHLALNALFAEYGLAQVDIAAMAEPSGVKATATVTFDATTPVSAAQTVTLQVMGRPIQIVWTAGQTAIQGATKLVTAINAATRNLPVSAANGGGTLAVVTISFKVKGLSGNDVKLSLTTADGTGGSVTLSGDLGSVVAGTTDPDPANVLSLISGREYDFILLCVSNTDATTASATTAVGRLKTHIDGLDQGFSAKLQQGVIGVTGTLSAAKTGSAQHNHPATQYAFCQAARSLPCEWGGAEVGARLREEANDAAVNRIKMPYRATLYGPADLVNDALTEAENEDALQSGLTPTEFDTSGNPQPNRPVTTYFKDTGGNPDDRILDTSRVSGVYRVAKDLRVNLPREFPQRKLSEDLTPGDDELPEGVTEVREVKAFVITRLRFFQKRGVVRRDKLDQVIKDGTLVVRVNPSDPTQCDLVIPIAIVPPLAKFSLVVQKIA